MALLLPVLTLVVAVLAHVVLAGTHSAETRPNLVFFMADDLGYGDLSSFGGHPTSQTPNLDKMVKDGMRFVSMYSASPVCSPSRSSVMTGRFMTRNGVWPGVFGPASVGGLALNETTLPSLLREAGYETFMAGKWHLGVGTDGAYLPWNRGFDHYYGVPYGIDMCSQVTVMDITRDGVPAGACFAPNVSCKAAQFAGGQVNFGGREQDVPCPFYVNATIVEQPTALLTIDDKYVSAAVSFIEAHADAGSPPFFMYFCSHHTHTPAFAKANFTNTSTRGWFGDHLRTLDWSLGEIMDAVDRAGLSEDTLVMFSADNGPSLTWEDLGGTNGDVRCGKGTTWEGGQRVPSIARWTGTVEPGSIAWQMTSSMDFFATALELARVPVPTDRTIDAISYAGLLQKHGHELSSHGNRTTFYYWGKNPSPAIGLHAVRHSTPTFGNWKMHWVTEGSHCNDDYPDKECPQSRGLRVLNQSDWLLYNLDASPGETRNLSVADYPDVVAKLTELKELHEAEPDIFGRSEIRRGSDNTLQPCAPSAVAQGCAPPGGGHGPLSPHPDPSGHGPWPEIRNFTILNQSLPTDQPYRKIFCDVTKSATLCEQQAAVACTTDVKCGAFALCDWSAKCSQEERRGAAFLFTASSSEHTSPRPFWTTWRHAATMRKAELQSRQWPLCCQKELAADWTSFLVARDSR